MKARNKEGEFFNFLMHNLKSRPIKTKIKIKRDQIKSRYFCWTLNKTKIYDFIIENKLNSFEKIAWNAFKNVCKIFLGWRKCLNYEDIAENHFSTFKVLVCYVSLKEHFLHSQVKIFPDNMVAVTDEHKEKFYKDVAQMEN